jgi:hypothetical protein
VVSVWVFLTFAGLYVTEKFYVGERLDGVVCRMMLAFLLFIFYILSPFLGGMFYSFILFLWVRKLMKKIDRRAALRPVIPSMIIV